jgi:light-regulated signal transduction histidine kinase (bacteriophytochrome)
MDTQPPRVDLDACDREPIHIPGSIQPHGLMLVADQESLLVHQVAGAIERRLDIAAWAGQPLGTLIGEFPASEVSRQLRDGTTGGVVGQIRTARGEMLDITAHTSARFVVVELEPASLRPSTAAAVMDRLAASAAGFERTTSLTTLCERAAVEFRRLTHFDRVMIYRFLDDGAGQVLAEDKRAGLNSFLHQHFPASDIPQQARALYLRNPSRVIPDISYEPAPLREADGTPPAALDLSDSILRSVSPIHLRYLANMGVKASASFSIVKDGALWGLIACHNETPHLIPYEVRSACRSLAADLARQVKAKEEARGYRQRIRLRSAADDMVALFSRDGSLDDALANHLDEFRRIMGGDGMAILRGSELITSGTCPGEPEIHALARWLLASRSDEPVFATDQLARHYPLASAFASSGSGVLAVTLSAEEPWAALWFRAEQVETVNWAGNPHKAIPANPQEMLTPRASFESWAETVRGRSKAWSLPEIDAATRLRNSLLEFQQGRRLRELNRQLTKILQDKDVLLQQKEFLIGEVNHRVQNSLQLVSSFLSMQARASDDPALQAALHEARRRLTSVALVHRRLYRGDQIALVDGARYIEELCADTVSFMGADWARHLTLHLSPVLIATDRAVILGLVLTELLINVNKYAYGSQPGPVQIELIEDLTHVRMIVTDQGVGKSASRRGFGSRFMEGLIGQLGGELVYGDNRPGVRAAVNIPLVVT